MAVALSRELLLTRGNCCGCGGRRHCPMTKQEYEREAAVCLEAGSIAMRKDRPDYGEAERQMQRAAAAIRYAREINNGTYRGEKY